MGHAHDEPEEKRGIMVYISLDELLPTSRAYGKGHDSLLGLVTGMLVMALSLQPSKRGGAYHAARFMVSLRAYVEKPSVRRSRLKTLA